MSVSISESVSEHAEGAQRLGSLMRRSDAEGIAQLGGHMAMLVLTGALVGFSLGTWWLALTLPAHGFVLIFLFAPLHESIHRTAFRSRWINSAVSWFCGALLMLPPQYFRAFHFAHHRYTQDPARDPELRVAKPTSRRAYLWTVSGIPFWQERARTLARHAIGRVGEAFIAASARRSIAREARILIAVYGLIAVAAVVSGSAAPLWYWVVPLLLGQPFLRMFLLAEHTGCPFVSDMLMNTRTTLTNRAMRRLAWNMPFHTAHHAYPGVPFHALPEAHRRIRHGVRFEAPGYGAVQMALIRAFPRTRTR